MKTVLNSDTKPRINQKMFFTNMLIFSHDDKSQEVAIYEHNA